MQFSAIVNRFIVKTYLNSTFTNDLKENKKFRKNITSYRLCSFKKLSSILIGATPKGKNILSFKILHGFLNRYRHKNTMDVCSFIAFSVTEFETVFSWLYILAIIFVPPIGPNKSIREE